MTGEQETFESKVYSKGRTTIPKEIREAISLRGPTRVSWEIVDGEAKVVPLIDERQKALGSMTQAPAKLDISVEGASIRDRLEAHADPSYEAGMRRVVPSALPAHLVRLPDLRRIAAEWSREHKGTAADELIELAGALWAAGWREEGIVAMILLSRSEDALQQLPWSTIEAWSSGFENWEHVDNSAALVTGRMLQLRPDLIDDIEAMAGSEQPWQRRLAIVTLIESTRHDARWRPQLEAMAQRLTGDKAPTLRKAVAWARKVINDTEGQIAG
jgi:3-methyladenine DNA glycosylase AlkD